MIKPLKIYAGNYDGRRGRAVAATSKTKAAELLGVSVHTVNQFFSTTDHPFYAPCLENPGTVYQYNLSDYSGNRKLIALNKRRR